ncbi:hypothetical protein CANINC_003327 [Pichia inconspicua]|uniref:Sm domain-containing protein n=1 Tax=Pichia inconspicua TaxID=52247 RepID=A0A4T0X0J7_9ASCO|nr:hypothetical protein CANINC_003327 [[Candida] inconspicua]
MSQEDIYLQSYPFTTAAAIIGFVDRKVSAILLDGRVIIGVLRTFDQFGNLVIHDGVERIYLTDKKQYAESQIQQIYVIRGENVLMMGDLDIDTEDNAIIGMERIDYIDAYKQHKEAIKESKLKGSEASKLVTKKGIYGNAYPG